MNRIDDGRVIALSNTLIRADELIMRLRYMLDTKSINEIDALHTQIRDDFRYLGMSEAEIDEALTPVRIT